MTFRLPLVRHLFVLFFLSLLSIPVLCQQQSSGGGGGFAPVGRVPAVPPNRWSGRQSSQSQQQYDDDHFQSSSQESALRPSSDAEKAATKEVLDAFLTRDSRNTFIARVYAILAGQLTVTALSVWLFSSVPSLSVWMIRPGVGAVITTLSLILSSIAWMVMALSSSARQGPLKWRWLGLFTVGEAISVGFISSFYTARSVASALLATVVAASAVSIYTIRQRNPKYDLSQWGAAISSAGLIFLAYGLIQVLQLAGVLPAGFLPYNEAIYGFMGASLFSFYLAYHTKLIVAGKHTRYQMNEKDYVFGAMTLYNDIINLFVSLLRLLGEERDR